MKNDKTPPSDGAMRAAWKILETFPPGIIEPMKLTENDTVFLARIIDRETGLKELIESLENILKWIPFPSDDVALEVKRGALAALTKAKGTTPGNGDLKEAMDAEFMHVMGVDE